MSIPRETLVQYQDEAVKMLASLITARPDNEIQVKSAAVKVQAAALLLNLDAPLSKEEVQEEFRKALAEHPEAARQIASSLDLG